jgi:hypothetical protein
MKNVDFEICLNLKFAQNIKIQTIKRKKEKPKKEKGKTKKPKEPEQEQTKKHKRKSPSQIGRAPLAPIRLVPMHHSL